MPATVIAQRDSAGGFFADKPKSLLKSAVHQHSILSSTGLQERLFTMMFSGLVYPQIWEDPEVDLDAMELTSSSHVVTIASGGCNVLNYLTTAPGRITAVDINPAHVALNRLKLAAVAHLPTHDDFHSFFAEADKPENIENYWRHISGTLDHTTRTYWERRGALGQRRIAMFRRNFYRFGLLGRFIGAAHVLARVLGVDFSVLMRATSLEEQRAFFDAKIAPIFEHRGFRWLVNQPASLFGLGIPPRQFIALADNRAMHEVLRERLETLICGFPLSENYFAWQAFARRYKPGSDDALPRYLQARHFDTLKANHDRVQILGRSLTEFLAEEPDESVDCFVLLDAQDWMTNPQLRHLWDQISRAARPGARVIFRTAGANTILPGRLSDKVLGQWRYNEAELRAFASRDRSSIYGGFHRYSFAGHM